MPLSCVVIDAGARYGLHPTWADLRDVAEFHMFEMDDEEARRLASKYAADSKITVHPVALFSSDTTVTFSVSEHQALNSVMEANQDLLRVQDYMLREFAQTAERAVEARSIDSMFAGKPVHFFKLDVEGAEHEVLKGARRQLSENVLGVRSEVLFAPIYVGARLFGELNQVMLDQGFELLNLDYTGAGNRAGRFTMPGRYGKLLSSDAVWTISPDRLFARSGERLAEDTIRLALFLMNNGATDIAIETLERTMGAGVDLIPYAHEPVFLALKKKTLLLFKSLLSLPQLAESDITATYAKIFGEEFPLMNKFYQSDLFN